VILHRALQVFGLLALLMCANLAFSATPWGGDGWSRARMLYAGAGAVSSLALIAIGGLGLALRRAEAQLAETREALRRIEERLASR
jgi:hypothetical protein